MAGDGYTREPTSWTHPLQATVAGFYVATSLLFIAGRIVSAKALHDSIRDQLVAHPPQGVSPAQTIDFANFVFGMGLVLDGLAVVVFLLLAAASYFRRWTWVFIVNMVMLGLIVADNVLNVVGSGQLNLGIPMLAVVTAMVGAGLFAWLTMALAKFGVWGCQRVPAASGS
jgi:hypothetical protein